MHEEANFSTPIAMNNKRDELLPAYTTERWICCGQCGAEYWISYPQALKAGPITEAELDEREDILKRILATDHERNTMHRTRFSLA